MAFNNKVNNQDEIGKREVNRTIPILDKKTRGERKAPSLRPNHPFTGTIGLRGNKCGRARSKEI